MFASLKMFAFLGASFLRASPLMSVVVEARDLSSNVVELQTGNWASHMGTGNRYFIKFYAPWCGYCKKLAPVWESLAGEVNSGDDPELAVKIAELDCTRHPDICTKVGVKGYPTLLWVESTGELFKYTGKMDSKETFKTFIKNQVIDSDYGIRQQTLKRTQEPAKTTTSKVENQKSTNPGGTGGAPTGTTAKPRNAGSGGGGSRKDSLMSDWVANGQKYPESDKWLEFMHSGFDIGNMQDWETGIELARAAAEEFLEIFHIKMESYIIRLNRYSDSIDKSLYTSLVNFRRWFENDLGPFSAVDSEDETSRNWAAIKNLYVWGITSIAATSGLIWAFSSLVYPLPSPKIHFD